MASHPGCRSAARRAVGLGVVGGLLSLAPPSWAQTPSNATSVGTPVTYDGLALVIANARAAAMVDFVEEFASDDGPVHTQGIRVRWRCVRADSPMVESGTDEAIERARSGWADGSQAWLAIGPFRVAWSFRGAGSGWVYWVPERERVMPVSDVDYDSCDLRRFLGGPDVAVDDPAPYEPEPLASIAEWLAWHRGRDRERTRAFAENFERGRPALPAEWDAELALALADPEPAIRAVAAVALGAQFTAAADHALVLRELGERDPDPFVRYCALFATMRATQEPAPLLPAMAALLESGDSRARRMAASVLGQFGEEHDAPVPALITALGRDDVPEVRGAVAEALHASRGHPLARAALRAALDDRDPVVRAWAIQAALREDPDSPELARRIAALLSDPDDDARRIAASAAAQRRTAPPPELRTALHAALLDPVQRVRELAIMSANWARLGGGADTDAVDPDGWRLALLGLGDPSEDVRHLATVALEKPQCAGPADLVLPALARALNDPGFWVRQGACFSFCSWGVAIAPYAGALRPLLEDESVEAIQVWRAAAAIGRLGAAGAKLRGALERRAAMAQGLVMNQVAAVVAATALDRIDASGGEPRLRACLAAVRLPTPVPMAYSFGEQVPAELPELASTLAVVASDRRGEVRAAALWVRAFLHGRGEPTLLAALPAAAADGASQVRATAAGLLGGLPSELWNELLLEPLRALLADDELAVRDAALAALLAQPSEVELPTLVGPLVEKLAGRLAASAAADETLRDADTEFLSWGARALGQLGERRDDVVDLLQRLAAHADPSVREAATAALGDG